MRKFALALAACTVLLAAAASAQVPPPPSVPHAQSGEMSAAETREFCRSLPKEKAKLDADAKEIAAGRDFNVAVLKLYGKDDPRYKALEKSLRRIEELHQDRVRGHSAIQFACSEFERFDRELEEIDREIERLEEEASVPA